jgi:ATP-dependent DNA helicase RecQ
MLGLCEVTSCRRKVLLNYFEDPGMDYCGNCDNCQIPPETWNATEAAQKILSTIYRTGQRFGVGYLLDVLLGKDNERIQQHGHQSLSTYGIGKDISEPQWRSVIRQLVVRGLIRVDVEGYSALQLTEQCRPILKGEQQLQLRKEDLKIIASKRQKNKVHVLPEHEKLWQALRECRKDLADEHGVPPYVIFHDAALQEMLECRPMSKIEMLAISGVGESKLDKYGTEFIEVICEHTEAL